ncbi:MAG: hypothetical protein Q9216_005529 [Gyalolechia sp. 2 TL-2023]
MISSTPHPSQTNKTSGSSGTPDTRTCTPTLNAASAPGTAASPKQGWKIRVLDRLPSSPLNEERFLDTTDPGTFPRAFIDRTIAGDYAPQHTSDLVRWPLLLRYGGVYADVGLLQIGDLDRLWNANDRRPGLGVDTEGMYRNPLLRGVPLMEGSFTIDEQGGRKIGPEEVCRLVTDYIIQGQVMTLVMGLVKGHLALLTPANVPILTHGVDYASR